jgi:hypothetical protein
MSNPKYNYAVVRTITSTRLIYAKDKNDLLELISEGVIDEELSLSEEYEEYTFYKINSNGERVELLEKDIINLKENEND